MVYQAKDTGVHIDRPIKSGHAQYIYYIIGLIIDKTDWLSKKSSFTRKYWENDWISNYIIPYHYNKKLLVFNFIIEMINKEKKKVRYIPESMLRTLKVLLLLLETIMDIWYINTVAINFWIFEYRVKCMNKRIKTLVLW